VALASKLGVNSADRSRWIRQGVEAAGIVEAVGPGVTDVAVGDNVTYTGFLNTLGAYSTERLMVAPLMKLPAGISCETAAAKTMRGLTAAYLMRRIYPFAAGDTILLQEAAAGGVGLIVSQWAKLLGLRVIGTVSTEEKAQTARAHGCDEVIDHSREDVARRTRELTDGAGVSVVLDSVGKSTFMSSLDAPVGPTCAAGPGCAARCWSDRSGWAEQVHCHGGHRPGAGRPWKH
jgi:NADPH2:quinone reductase